MSYTYWKKKSYRHGMPFRLFFNFLSTWKRVHYYWCTLSASFSVILFPRLFIIFFAPFYSHNLLNSKTITLQTHKKPNSPALTTAFLHRTIGAIEAGKLREDRLSPYRRCWRPRHSKERMSSCPGTWCRRKSSTLFLMLSSSTVPKSFSAAILQGMAPMIITSSPLLIT